MAPHKPDPTGPFKSPEQRDREAALGEALRRCYRDALTEDVPESLRDLLKDLD